MNQYQAPSFSVLDVLRGMARRKLLMVSCLALGVAAGFTVLTIYKPSYLAEARILIDNQATPYDAANVTQADATRDQPIDERFVQSQVTVLQSDDLAMRVITERGLAQRPDFDPLAGGIGTSRKLLIALGFADDPTLMTAEQRALKKLATNLTIYPLPGADAIGIKFTAADGKTAAEVANALAETFVLSTREAKSGTNDRAREWLSQQIATLQQKVVASDAAVETFRTESGLIKGQTSTLGTQEISELNTQITQAEAASAEASAKASEIRRLLKTSGTVDANSDVMSSPTIQSLRQQQVAAQRKITELSATYLSNHPKMVAAAKELAAVNMQLRSEALKIVQGLQGQANIAAARAESLRKSLDALKGREGTAAQDAVKLNELEREAKANRDQLEAMMQRFADSNTRKNLDLQPGFARIIQKASAPAIPYFPKTGPIMLLTSLAGLGLGMGLAFLFEIMAQAARLNAAAAGEPTSPRPSRREAHAISDDMRGNVRVPELVPQVQAAAASAVQAAAVAPPPKPTKVEIVAQPAASNVAALPAIIATLGMLKTSEEARHVLAQMEGHGKASDAIAQLAAQIQDLRQPGKSLACAMAGIGAGYEVGTSALAVARTLARLGVKTILVDLESAKPLIAGLLELPAAPGLMDLVSGKADFTKAIQNDNETGLQTIRHGQSADVSGTTLASRMEAITRTLAGIYDVVLIHVGEATPNTLALVKGCSAAILYAPGKRQRDAAAAAFTLKAHGLGDISIVNVDQSMPAAA